MTVGALCRKAVYFVSRKIIFMLPLRIDRDKVVFSGFYVRGYSDNPKAIADEMIRQGLDYKLVCITDDRKALPSEMIGVRPRTIAALYHLRTAGVWIDNCRKENYVRKQRGQFYIQTWHGFPLKQIEKDVEGKLSSIYVQAAMNDSRMCDLMISDSDFLTDIYERSFWYNGEILRCGSPRNDVLVKNEIGLRDAVRGSLGIPVKKKIVLYAPTFRSESSLNVYDIDFQALTNRLCARFGGDWIVLLRLHPNIASKSKQLAQGADVMDVTWYHDTQHLLVVADALVTDYSSIMFDYLLTERPGFLFANDIEKYKEDRDFYFDIQEAPYQLATSNEDLLANIDNFEEDVHNKRIKAFFDKFGIVRDSLAAPVVVERIKKELR